MRLKLSRSMNSTATGSVRGCGCPRCRSTSVRLASRVSGSCVASYSKRSRAARLSVMSVNEVTTLCGGRSCGFSVRAVTASHTLRPSARSKRTTRWFSGAPLRLATAEGRSCGRSCSPDSSNMGQEAGEVPTICDPATPRMRSAAGLADATVPSGPNTMTPSSSAATTVAKSCSACRRAVSSAHTNTKPESISAAEIPITRVVPSCRRCRASVTPPPPSSASGCSGAPTSASTCRPSA